MQHVKKVAGQVEGRTGEAIADPGMLCNRRQPLWMGREKDPGFIATIKWGFMGYLLHFVDHNIMAAMRNSGKYSFGAV